MGMLTNAIGHILTGNTQSSQATKSFANQIGHSYTYQKQMSLGSQPCDAGDGSPDYMPVEINKPYMRDLLRYMSDDDCSELLRAIVDAISKEGNDYRISKSIETSIIQFLISKG